ncbi:hypothetical protein [Nitratireductor pacificus]|nr:hypothetical protein [Nitratireductor pacificus]
MRTNVIQEILTASANMFSDRMSASRLLFQKVNLLTSSRLGLHTMDGAFVNGAASTPIRPVTTTRTSRWDTRLKTPSGVVL